METFVNAPNTLFGKEKEQILREAIIQTRLLLGKKIPIIIAGKEYFTDKIIETKNPSRPEEILANVSCADERHAEKAVNAIKESPGAKRWAQSGFSNRSDILDRAADLMELRRISLIALEILEIGKHSEEADKEISEAIDFLRYYALCAREIEKEARESVESPPGEKNTVTFSPIGNPPICLSIQPWNFPIAISIGPMAAALVCGYSVLYKPSEDSSLIGYHLVSLMHEAGIPIEVLHFFPGNGEVIGKYLVEHPAVKTIAFTGSLAVAREIERSVSRFNLDILPTLPRKEHQRKHIAAMETGGCNAIIVDPSAYMPEAIKGVSISAYGFAGQKCSSCQRVIIADDGKGNFYEKFVLGLRSAVQGMSIGSPEFFGTFYGPVINKMAYKRVTEMIRESASLNGRITQGKVRYDAVVSAGWYIPPTFIEGLSNRCRIVQEEVFGPLCFVLRAKTIEEAVALANDTSFGLTGGICSRNEQYIEYVRNHLIVGNGYVNKPIVGAVVGRQPFGGLKESGGFGFKAGGQNYLRGFLETRVWSENTTRQGLLLDLK